MLQGIQAAVLYVLLQINDLKELGPTCFYRTNVPAVPCKVTRWPKTVENTLLSFYKHTNYMVKRSSESISYNELLTLLLPSFLLEYLWNTTKTEIQNSFGPSNWIHGANMGLKWDSPVSLRPFSCVTLKNQLILWTNFASYKWRSWRRLYMKMKKAKQVEKVARR